MKKIGFLYTIFSLLLVSGCTKNMLKNIDDNAINKDSSIAFRTNATLTRGTPQDDLTAYKNINLIVYSHTGNYAEGKSLYRKTVLDKNDARWDYSPHMFWPDGRSLSFLAYAIESNINYATASGQEGVYVKDNGNDSSPTIEYIVPTDVTKQPDLIVTTLLNKKGVTKNITLPMKHALSCVSFCATSPDPTSKVKSITLKDVYRSGTLKFDSEDIEWENLSDKGVRAFSPGIDPDKSLTNDASTNYNYLMQRDGYLMMIPQKLVDAKIEVIYWKGTEGSERTITYTLPTNIEWKPGLKYIYSFDEAELEGVVTYYEKYSDGSVGLYYINSGTFEDTLIPDGSMGSNTIIDAGYGLLVPNAVYTNNSEAKLLIGVGTNTQRASMACDGSIRATNVLFNGVEMDCVLYPITQDNYPFSHVKNEDEGGIQPKNTNEPDIIKAKFSTGITLKTYGYCLPHYARGVYADNTQPSTHYVRTPIHMRNISYQTGKEGYIGLTNNNIYIQEFSTMDYIGANNSTIRGNDVGATGDFTEAIVRGLFNGKFDGKKQYKGGDRTASATIKNLKINNNKVDNWVFIWGSYYVALFEWVYSNGEISNLTNENCELSQNIDNSINAAMYVGFNDGGTLDNLINNAKITNRATWRPSRTGGIVAYNGSATGGEVNNCKNMADITGTIVVGGIAAYNNYQGKITNCTNGNNITKPTVTSTYIRYEDTDSYPIPRVGGIVGLQQCGNYPDTPPPLTPTISECINYGRITAIDNRYFNKFYVGGIVGENDWNWQAEKPTTAATAFGEVSKCTNYGDVSGSGASEQGVGGIAGANNGFVRESQSTGLIVAKERATAGGVVGYNTNIVEDCLYYNTGSIIPITTDVGYVGGIVGHNTGHNSTEASGSAYVNRCIYLAKSPVNSSPVGDGVAGYAPIAGNIAEYLVRNAKGDANLSNDGTAGKTPFYTVENCFFLSGSEYNDIGDLNYKGLYEPAPDIKTIVPFPYGRFPLGINRLTTSYFNLLPFMNFWSKQGWQKTSTLPYLTLDIPLMPNVDRGAGYYLPYDIINSITAQKTSTTATYTIQNGTIPGIIRVELFNAGTENLGSLTSITITTSALNFASMAGDTYAGLLIKAPQGWNITINGGTGDIDTHGDHTHGYYVFLTNDKTATSITMTK